MSRSFIINTSSILLFCVTWFFWKAHEACEQLGTASAPMQIRALSLMSLLLSGELESEDLDVARNHLTLMASVTLIEISP